jgi:hypothetical protein
LRDLYEYDEPNEIQVQSSAIASVVNGFEGQQPTTKNGYPIKLNDQKIFIQLSSGTEVKSI